MSVIRSISGVPLFSTAQEALAWAMAKGITGYHTHGDGIILEKGYMGGANHQQAAGTPLANTPLNTPSNTPSNTSGTIVSGGY